VTVVRDGAGDSYPSAAIRAMRRGKRRTLGNRYKFAKKRNSRKISRIRTTGLGVPSGVPDRMPIKLDYAESAGYSSALPTGLSFLANSIFDPQNTVTGWTAIPGQQSNSQAFLRDQWATLYGNYRVLACKINIEFINLTTTPTVITLYPDDDPYTSLANADVILGSSRPRSIRRVLTSNAAGGKVSMKMYLPIWKIVGESPGLIADDAGYLAAMGSSPTFGAYYNCLIDSADGTTAMNLAYNVRLRYYCILNDPQREQAAS